MKPRTDSEMPSPRRILVVAPAFLLVCFLFLLNTLNGAFAENKTVALGFQRSKDSDAIPQGWELITYPGARQNEMTLTKEGKRTVLYVKSLGSASSLLKRLDVDIREFPLLVWRWKISRIVGMAIEDRKDRNDSAARVRVIFGRGGEKPKPVFPEIEEFLKSLGINPAAREPAGFKIDYIWANRLSQGLTLDFPGSHNHKVIVVESGKGRVGRWVWEKRNLVEDYERLFEAAPPGLSGVVILTDTDQTNEGVEAWYSNIVLMRK